MTDASAGSRVTVRAERAQSTESVYLAAHRFHGVTRVRRDDPYGYEAAALRELTRAIALA